MPAQVLVLESQVLDNNTDIYTHIKYTNTMYSFVHYVSHAIISNVTSLLRQFTKHTHDFVDSQIKHAAAL